MDRPSQSIKSTEPQDPTMSTTSIDDQDELPLQQLKPWVSPSTYDWIQCDDRKRTEFQKELQDEPINLFADDGSDNEQEFPRVQQWTSSLTNPDGIGGYYGNVSDGTARDGDVQSSSENDGDNSGHSLGEIVSIVFILSESYEGFGDTIWSSSRHIANQLANPSTCRKLISPLLTNNYNEQGNDGITSTISNNHPLLGRSFVELGAGAGVPSWTAMKCGARVISTDLASPNRIRCMAECIARNIQNMKDDGSPLYHALEARACPCTWGKSSGMEGVKQALKESSSSSSEEERGAQFEIVVAADCAYMPWLHSDLLDTIDYLLHEKQGVALIPFCLHGNTKDEDVWGIVKLAEEKGFEVEQLEDVQLTPPKIGMEDKQGLVHTLRLTRRQR